MHSPVMEADQIVNNQLSRKAAVNMSEKINNESQIGCGSCETHTQVMLSVMMCPEVVIRGDRRSCCCTCSWEVEGNYVNPEDR